MQAEFGTTVTYYHTLQHFHGFFVADWDCEGMYTVFFAFNYQLSPYYSHVGDFRSSTYPKFEASFSGSVKDKGSRGVIISSESL